MKKRNGFAIIIVIVSLILIGNFVEMQNMHIAKLNGRICGAKRSHSVFEQPNCYQSGVI